MLLSTCSMGGYIRDQGTLIKFTDDCVCIVCINNVVFYVKRVIYYLHSCPCRCHMYTHSLQCCVLLLSIHLRSAPCQLCAAQHHCA